MKSFRRELDCDHLETLQRLKIGELIPVKFDQFARWESHGPIGKWALYLFQRVWTLFYWAPAGLPEDLKEISKLTAFSKTTWKSWWKAAKSILDNYYIDVFEIPELNDWAKSPKKRNERIHLTTVQDKYKKRTKRWEVRRFIYRAIEEKFESFAGASRVK